MLNNNWHCDLDNINKARAYSVKYNISFYIIIILLNRNVDIKDIDIYLKYSISDYIKQYPIEKNLPEIVETSDRIKTACENKENIFIYGDYDVDGASSTALLINFFKQFNIEANFHIPNRFSEGYGLTKYGIQKAFDTFKPTLLIVVDCGSSSDQEISFAKSLGMDVIVMDHHIYHSRPKDLYSIVNPNFEFLKSQYSNLCASGVVFLTLLNSIIQGRKSINKHIWNQISIMNQIEIASIATICDCMTLKGINHIIVKKGINKINNQDTSLNIKKLLNHKSNIIVNDISFLIGPRLNAGGRLGRENFATLSLLNSDRYTNTPDKLIVLNNNRKIIEQNVLDKANANLQIFTYFTISIGENWHEGVIGIIASKLKEKYKKPSFVLSLKDDLYTGSARSINPIHLGEIISLGKQLNIIKSGGGHELAGGLSIHKTKILDFIQFLEKHITKSANIRKLYDCEIYFPTNDIIDNIKSLEPFGNGFPEPTFLIQNVNIRSTHVIKDNHIGIIIRKNNLFIRSIIFNSKKSIKKDNINIICNLRYNYKYKKIDIFIIDIL